MIGNKPGNGNTDRKTAPQLATEQYSELNATFYVSGGPHEYIRARLQAIIFTLTDSEEAEKILDLGLNVGPLRGQASMRMSEEARARYAQMESTVLLHHAGESLLRLWFAHKESSLCPWLAVASLTSARDFKIEAEKYANADTSHMTADDIASVFLGGRTPEEAGVAIPKESWEDSVNGFRELLRVVADQITGQANLYNAAKHGLVGIPADHGDVNLGDIRVAGGIGITYLQKKPNDPANHNSPRSWWATTSFPSLATDLFLIELIIRAIHSLWNVARRKFAGFPGELVLISHDEVLTAKAIGPIADQRPVQDLSQKLPTYTDGSGPQRFAAVELSANAIRLGPEMLRAYERISGSSNEIAFIDLPLRQADRRKPSTSGNQFFHFSPHGSSEV
ncbi:hypothetical protein ACX800_10665 [Paenarthrobacter nitroguajacolicus]|uniref:hypothetical protein n=1 Tax=Paenarthrobacter nitroguajacolicus TaxID=211146 RepID=UPI003D257FEE